IGLVANCHQIVATLSMAQKAHVFLGSFAGGDFFKNFCDESRSPLPFANEMSVQAQLLIAQVPSLFAHHLDLLTDCNGRRPRLRLSTKSEIDGLDRAVEQLLSHSRSTAATQRLRSQTSIVGNLASTSRRRATFSASPSPSQ